MISSIILIYKIHTGNNTFLSIRGFLFFFEIRQAIIPYGLFDG